MTSSLIERVARAIGHQLGHLMIDQRTPHAPLEDWDWISDRDHFEALGLAEAAIKAMHEPSNEMLDAGWAIDEETDHGQIWRAMIDAALSESPAPDTKDSA